MLHRLIGLKLRYLVRNLANWFFNSIGQIMLLYVKIGPACRVICLAISQFIRLFQLFALMQEYDDDQTIPKKNKLFKGFGLGLTVSIKKIFVNSSIYLFGVTIMTTNIL